MDLKIRFWTTTKILLIIERCLKIGTLYKIDRRILFFSFLDFFLDRRKYFCDLMLEKQFPFQSGFFSKQNKSFLKIKRNTIIPLIFNSFDGKIFEFQYRKFFICRKSFFLREFKISKMKKFLSIDFFLLKIYLFQILSKWRHENKFWEEEKKTVKNILNLKIKKMKNIFFRIKIQEKLNFQKIKLFCPKMIFFSWQNSSEIILKVVEKLPFSKFFR